MLQYMMAEHHIDTRGGEIRGDGDKLDTLPGEFVAQEAGQIKADFPSAAEPGQVPAIAYAIFQHDIGWTDLDLEFFRPGPHHPREGGRGDFALRALIPLPGSSLVAFRGWIRHQRH